MAAGEGTLRAAERQRTPAGSGGEQGGAGVWVESRGGARAAQGKSPLAQLGCRGVQSVCNRRRPARVGEDDRERWTLGGSPGCKVF